MARVPTSGITRFVEPFLGGGAVYFAFMAEEERAPGAGWLNDLNHDLTTTFEVVQGKVDALVARLAVLQERYLAGDEEQRAAFYYAERERAAAEAVDVAARFIFLNKTCFNGLYRVNRQGVFNVPHGRYRQPRILDEAGLRAASAALAGTTITNRDFEAVMAEACEGDFFYIDPPFEPLSATSSFTGYTAAGFGREEQLRLLEMVEFATERGAAVLLSNSAAEWICGLYDGARRYDVEVLSARRAINSRGDRRGTIGELAVRNYRVTPDGYEILPRVSRRADAAGTSPTPRARAVRAGTSGRTARAGSTTPAAQRTKKSLR